MYLTDSSRLTFYLNRTELVSVQLQLTESLGSYLDYNHFLTDFDSLQKIKYLNFNKIHSFKISNEIRCIQITNSL